MVLFASVSGQNEAGAPRDFPNPNDVITKETDFRYFFLFDAVFPNAELGKAADETANSPLCRASSSIRLRRLFGKGFSRLSETRRIVIEQTRWLETKDKRKFLIVLFAAEKVGDLPLAPDFYALAAFRYVRRKVPDSNVYNSLHYKWTYEFDLADAVDPREGNSEVELPKDIPAVKNERGEEAFWLLNTRTDKARTVRQYNALDLRNNRLFTLIKNFPPIAGYRDDTYRSEGVFEIVPSENRARNPLGEIRIMTMIWSRKADHSKSVKPDLRGVKRFSSVWQTLPGKRRRIIRLKFYEEHYETLAAEASSENKTGIRECDEFLEKYETCLWSVMPSSKWLSIQAYLNQSRGEWKRAASSSPAESREALVAMCRQSKEAARQNPATFGCDWGN